MGVFRSGVNVPPLNSEQPPQEQGDGRALYRAGYGDQQGEPRQLFDGRSKEAFLEGRLLLQAMLHREQVGESDSLNRHWSNPYHVETLSEEELRDKSQAALWDPNSDGRAEPPSLLEGH